MFNLNGYLNKAEVNNVNEVNDLFKIEIIEIFIDIIKNRQMFSEDNFKFYYYDEFILDTAVGKNNIATLYVEINQPDNISKIINNSTQKSNSKNKIVAPDLHFSLSAMREELYNASIKRFNKDTLIWNEKYSVNYAHNIQSDDGTINTYYFKVIPCITYKNLNNVNGIMYYNENKSLIEIEYPKLSVLNFNLKNKITNGLYKDFVIMFKNIFMFEKKVNELPFEIFEIILYNVPDEIFIDKTIETFYKIINYVRNFNIKDYQSLDKQDYAFTSQTKSLSVIYAGHVIKKVSSYLRKLNNK